MSYGHMYPNKPVANAWCLFVRHGTVISFLQRRVQSDHVEEISHAVQDRSRLDDNNALTGIMVYKPERVLLER